MVSDAAELDDTYVAIMKEIAGYARNTGLSVEHQVNGLFTYGRQVCKVDVARVRSANHAVIEGPARERRPNILWICTDQQRTDTLGCYGNPFTTTPNIDALTAGGVVFDHAYAQSPVCTPSRALPHRPLSADDRVPSERPVDL